VAEVNLEVLGYWSWVFIMLMKVVLEVLQRTGTV